MTLPGLELFLRVGLATLLGIAIGVERQWRARMAGAWMWREAVVGAGIIIVGNTLLYPLAGRIDRVRSRNGREIPSAEYVFEVECAADSEPRVRVLLLDALTDPGLQLTSVRSAGTTSPSEITLRAEVSAPARHDELLETPYARSASTPTSGRSAGPHVTRPASAGVSASQPSPSHPSAASVPHRCLAAESVGPVDRSSRSPRRPEHPSRVRRTTGRRRGTRRCR